MRRASLFAGLLGITGSHAIAQQFPVPRAEAEFSILARAVIPEAEALNGNGPRFRALALPFAPFDLQVRKAASPKEAETLRSFHLGLVGAASRVDAVQLAHVFHCGPPCAEKRKAQLKAHLTVIRALVTSFRTTSLNVIAQWSPTEYRLNDVFFRADGLRHAVPSPELGFVPSGVWKVANRSSVLNSVGVSEQALDSMLRNMRKADIAAVIRDANGIRVVWAGIGDNEAGLIFADRISPTLGQHRADGAQYTIVERLAPSVYFYTTS